MSDASQPTSDVLVLGAGAAGLQAAARLAAAGLRTTIIEARDRVGGRIWTKRRNGAELPVELGAEFVHGRPPEIVTVAGAANLRLPEIEGTPWFSRDGRLEPSADFFKEVEEVMSRLSTPPERDRSFREFVDECCPGSSEAKADALRYVEGFHAAHPDRVSARSLRLGEEASEQIEGDKQYWVLSGYDALVNYLHSHIGGSELCLSTVAEEIRWSPGTVEVRCRSTGPRRKFAAKRALITLPLGVLQAEPGSEGAIRFNPELPEKKKVLSLLEMGPALRVSMRFRHRFWDELAEGRLAGMSFLFSRDPDVPTWWAKLGSRMLTGWAGGPNGERMARCSEQEFAASAARSLARIMNLDPSLVEELMESADTHNWVTDPYCRGGYSYVLVGGEDAPRLLAEPVANTLFFAGEATEFTGHNGTVNGALASGVRAANEILDRLP